MCVRTLFLERKKLKGKRFGGADDEARTRYLHLGKVALYQMSYIRSIYCVFHYNTVCEKCQPLFFDFFSYGSSGFVLQGVFWLFYRNFA